jgi:hypothetical protein
MKFDRLIETPLPQQDPLRRPPRIVPGPLAYTASELNTDWIHPWIGSDSGKNVWIGLDRVRGPLIIYTIFGGIAVLKINKPVYFLQHFTAKSTFGLSNWKRMFRTVLFTIWCNVNFNDLRIILIFLPLEGTTDFIGCGSKYTRYDGLD